MRVDGSDAIFGGTSAVAPLWAGLIARINAAKGTATAGFINAKLYKNPTALNDVTQGNNGSFAAAPGWDACTGLGSPDGKKLSKVRLFESLCEPKAAPRNVGGADLACQQNALPRGSRRGSTRTEP